MRTRCQNGNVMVAWSLCRTMPRAYARVAAHHLPAPAGRLGVALQDRAIFLRRDAVRVTAAHVDSLAAAAVELFHHVRLARTATERFIAEDEFLIHHERRASGTKNHSP